MRNEGVGWMVAFIGGFLLGSLLTGGVFGTYLLFGVSRYQMEARMEADRAHEAMREAAMQRDLLEKQRMETEEARRKTDERIRELEAKQKP
jgi:hypothetical protein